MNQSSRVCFDGQQIFIGWEDEPMLNDEVPALLEFLFGDMPPQQNCEGDTQFSIAFDQSSDCWTLTRDDNVLFVGQQLNGLGNVLSGEALFSLIENNSRGMAIHAGLVSNDRGSVLLPADSGSGKSSVTTWMLSRGWRYHTDELVIVDVDSGRLDAFTRPLNIKTHGKEPVAALLNLDLDGDLVRPCNMVTMIPHREVNPTWQSVIPPLVAIVFPVYSRDMEPDLRPIGGAEAGLELMRSNVIARNLPGHGFAGITRLVRDLPAYRLHYQHFDNLDELLGPLST